MLELKQNSLFAEIDARLAEMSDSLRAESNSVLQSYGFTEKEMFPVNRRSYFKALHRLEIISGEQIKQYCAIQFSVSTTAQSVHFLVKHRLLLGKCLIRLRIAGFRHFYCSNTQAAIEGLAELTKFAHFVAPLRSAETTH